MSSEDNVLLEQKTGTEADHYYYYIIIIFVVVSSSLALMLRGFLSALLGVFVSDPWLSFR